ncbi:MAG: polysaccharide lyase [Prevotella sp.]|nr:polysaccharide lyase [Prevotella sp.]
MKRLLTFAATLLFSVTAVLAQYPQLTDEAKHLIDSLQKQWAAHSGSAWEKAFPIVVEEAKQGRPFVPWASRPYDLRQAKIPAFPGAEGGGMYTFGGRGGKVLTVTNLNDSGPGSFRWACEQGGARIVVFNVSGIIRLKSPIYVRAPYITIAGQTAPGDGVIIAGESFQVDTHDVIVRHMRFRRGETLVWHREDSFGGNPVGNIMIDHCSCEWGLDENISFYRHMFDLKDGKDKRKEPTVNVTIQNTISAKALDTWNHSFGSTIGGENTTFMRNLWADNTGRNPSIGWGGVFNFINNIVYNWVHRTADGGEYTTMSNFINNYYKPGPLTPKDSPVGHRIIKSESRSQGLFPFKQFGRIYAVGNVMEGFPEITKDNWNGGIQTADKDGDMDATELALMRSDEPFQMPPVTIMGAERAFDWVLSNAGATVPCRDIVDQRICEEVRTGVAYYVPDYEKQFKVKGSGSKKAKSLNSQPSTLNSTLTPYGDMWGLHPKSQNDEGTFKYRRLGNDSYKQGIITDPRQMGGYPVYKDWQPYKDSDLDGMPDEWERANGLNPNDPNDANGDLNGDGYTNIEKYINAIPTQGRVDWRNLNNNYDTLAERGRLM